LHFFFFFRIAIAPFSPFLEGQATLTLRRIDILRLQFARRQKVGYSNQPQKFPGSTGPSARFDNRLPRETIQAVDKTYDNSNSLLLESRAFSTPACLFASTSRPGSGSVDSRHRQIYLTYLADLRDLHTPGRTHKTTETNNQNKQ
jgi:hypothetical protein